MKHPHANSNKSSTHADRMPESIFITERLAIYEVTLKLQASNSDTEHPHMDISVSMNAQSSVGTLSSPQTVKIALTPV
jgi:hypothetical protein